MKALWLVVKRCGGCEWLVTVVAFVICIFVAAVVCCTFAVIVACYFVVVVVVVVVVCYFVVVVFYFVVVVVYNFDVVDKIGYNFFGVVLVVIVVVVVGAVVGILTGKAIGKRGRHAVVLGKRFRRCLLATTTATATATAPTTATSTTTTFTITTTTISSITTIISASIAARCTACAANHLMFVGWFDGGGVGKGKTGLGISRPSLASRVTPSGQMGMFQL